ncbi:uncharacterized protein LOC111446040 isoform X1 [Cucurbita moschata]|uniref:Uncharacterized protein LOC111446040 isoform X1 n=1 Tax=Cucurbita moschata TaxID=3662 RepID=A0A6J1FJK8_CUCMO|nr:uncharacterized protein LOC111446040 isoform X1 [Cucurbita moschata]
MQLLNSEETVADSSESGLGEERNLKSSNLVSFEGDSGNETDDSVIDVSGKNLDSHFLEGSHSSVKGLYIFRNAFNLIPKSVGNFRELRMLKFFGNEINLFPPELKNFSGLECLQVKLSSPGFGGLSLHELKDLKELELSKIPPKPSSFPILSEIAGLKCLTKLTVCHFSIRYLCRVPFSFRFLPPEIGCLDSLEYLDLSFNKMKSLPAEIGYLNALISLRVANNKLVELPPALSSLQKLENLDLSSNRLTSLGSLEFVSMHSLKNLNLQYNKFLRSCQIPSWICCNFEGNCGDKIADEECISSTVEMDVYEATIPDNSDNFPHKGIRNLSSNLLMGSSTNSRSFASRKSGKRWRRRHYLQQKARQERLNNSRKWKGVDHHTEVKIHENHELGRLDTAPTSETTVEDSSVIEELYDSKETSHGKDEGEDLIKNHEKDNFDVKKELPVEDCSGICIGAAGKMTRDDNECHEPSETLPLPGNEAHDLEGSSSQISKDNAKLKRYSERELDNPKPCKSRKAAEDSSSLSCKYNNISFCSVEDYVPDGFYDAGRDRPFMSLRNYEQNFHLDSREVILVNREHDELLDSTVISAKSLVLRLKQINRTQERHQVLDDMHIIQVLALFVSDHFGGSDRSAMVEKTRKAVSGSKYQKPFVCTCSTGDRNNLTASTKLTVDNYEDILFTDICEKSLRAIKASRNSVIVPLGALKFGVCRHRALLLKYLCDRMEPPVPCELVRGYLDFLPHAWNVILVKRGNALVRMVVDACRPNDIREEADPEYFCRYIPLSRAELPISFGMSPSPGFSFPSLSNCDEIEKAPSSSVLKCKLGSVEAAAKLRMLEVCESSFDEIRNFEYSCLGEVRILGALKHSCIVQMYGHQISSEWIPSEDGKPKRRLLRSAIFLEHVKGGSLKSYLDKLYQAGKKHIPMDLALHVARDVASALVELHSKHIIHRDIKSENVLIDFDENSDGVPMVKLCDFDRAVPLRSSLHTCCIAHTGIPPPDVCVGTPRWMAPEVLRAMHTPNVYGLEVDIWSFGCLLFELLTFQIPYLGLTELQIFDQLQMGKRPELIGELEEEALGLIKESAMSQSVQESDGSEKDQETKTFLIDLFCKCTKKNPNDRPTAEELHKILLEHTAKVKSLEKLAT